MTDWKWWDGLIGLYQKKEKVGKLSLYQIIKRKFFNRHAQDKKIKFYIR